MAFYRGFPDKEKKADMRAAMNCVVDALRDHQQEGGEVEPGYWPKYRDDMRDYVCLFLSIFCPSNICLAQIFADRSSFRGIIKNKAIEIVRIHYDFQSKEPMLNQEGQIAYVAKAIAELKDHSQYLRYGRDENVR
jgi:hypothetical protein